MDTMTGAAFVVRPKTNKKYLPEEVKKTIALKYQKFW